MAVPALGEEVVFLAERGVSADGDAAVGSGAGHTVQVRAAGSDLSRQRPQLGGPAGAVPVRGPWLVDAAAGGDVFADRGAVGGRDARHRRESGRCRPGREAKALEGPAGPVPPLGQRPPPADLLSADRDALGR